MKTGWLLMLLTVLLGTAAQADFLRVEGGAGAWNADPSGSLRYENGPWIDAADELGYSSETAPYAWLYIKHFVPLVPNLRLEYTDLSYSGRTNKSLSWGGIDYTQDAYSEMDVTQYDAILYYNLLDNTFWMTLDVGVGAKYAKVRYMIRDDSGLTNPYEKEEELIIPEGYLRARVQIPATDIGAEADLKYIGNGSSEIYDARIKLDYTLDFIPVIQPGIELGYRIQHIEFDEDDYDTKIDLDLQGFYLGAMLRF